MKIRPLFFTSSRFLLSKTNNVKIRSVIAGVALSLLPLVMVMIVSDGMIYGITQRYIELGNYHYQIKKINKATDEEVNSVIQSVKDLDDITGIYREQQGIALLNYRDFSYGVVVRGLEPDIYVNDPAFKRLLNVNSGVFDLADIRFILISNDLAEKTGIKPGQEVRLLTAREIPGRAPLLRPVSFIVKGIVSTGYYEIDGLTVYIPYKKARQLYSDNNPVIGIKVKNPIAGNDKFEDEILGRIQGNWFFKKWDSIEPHKFSSFLNIKFTLLIIMSIIVLVGSVNISSSIVMLVMEKAREIAILKSSGARTIQIIMIFCAMSTLMGTIGVFFGLVTGLFLGVNINTIIYILESLINFFIFLFNMLLKSIGQAGVGRFKILNPSYYLQEIPVVINYQLLSFFCAFNIFLSFLAGVIPGLKAGRMKPVEIFQKHI